METTLRPRPIGPTRSAPRCTNEAATASTNADRKPVTTTRPISRSTRLDELRNCPGHRVSHLNYTERRREGRFIGSGQIDGACQNIIGRRLKQTAAHGQVCRDPRSLACVPAVWLASARSCTATQGVPIETSELAETEIRFYTHLEAIQKTVLTERPVRHSIPLVSWSGLFRLRSNGSSGIAFTSPPLLLRVRRLIAIP